MKYKMFLSTAYMAAMLLPLMGAKTNEVRPIEDFDINTVEFIEVEEGINLGFDSSKYLPEDFDPYTTTIDIQSIDFIEDDQFDLDFDTKNYLPEDFNAFM